MRWLTFRLWIGAAIIGLSYTAQTAETQAPNIQLASGYRSNIEISQYYVSEKLDGVRAYWDGRQLISRRGNVFLAPKWFIKDFPPDALDGELWIGRQSFDKVSGIVRQKQANNPNWQQLRFMIFDLPLAPVVFSLRLARIRELVAQSASPYLSVIEQVRLGNEQELQQWLKQIVAQGAEGLMLHRANAHYQTSRSSDLMKLKLFNDAEATVLAHLAGKGKFSGMLGALLVKNDDGITFKIGSGFSNLERANPPQIGSVITYKFYGKTKNNVPRFASFLRVRNLQ